MKKIIFKTILLFFILFPNMCFANSIKATPNLPGYNAIVSNINGAEYYEFKNGKYEKKGEIYYNTEIKIINDGNEYAYFTYNGSDYYIKVVDIDAIEDSFVLTDYTSKKEIENEKIKIFSTEDVDGVAIYSGPSKTFKKIGLITTGTDVTAIASITDEFNGGAVTWYYVKYNDLKGWICFYTGGIGVLNEKENSFMTIDIDVFSVEDVVAQYPGNYKINDNAKKTNIPFGTITSYYSTSSWFNARYIEYNKEYYLLEDWNTKLVVNNNEKYITNTEINLYDKANEGSIVIKKIPSETILISKYINYRAPGLNWIYVEQNDIKGWICNDISKSIISIYGDIEEENEINEVIDQNIKQENDKAQNILIQVIFFIISIILLFIIISAVLIFRKKRKCLLNHNLENSKIEDKELNQ